ncbi:zinc finger protein ZAT1-like [Amaranthus tricolor]|uniref:zinc finger protein ZAT1-like n=1 Tax=Amaranthus tricolor TaxID=29722 RepID=UPI00258E582A|nr:zinc finger protein ZAT1-like [Amaranthus tricolor]
MEELGNQEALKHECELCSKKFRCGKSLGGHMRSHVMAANAQKRKPKKVVKHDNEEKQDDNGVELSRETPKQQEEDDDYSLFNDSKEQLNVAMEVQSGTENGDGYSSVHPEIDKEMKKVAKWLVELSRNSFNLVGESSESNGSQYKTAKTGNTKIKIIFNSKSKNVKGHKCPFCTRVFRSDQALIRGHKRSHLMG